MMCMRCFTMSYWTVFVTQEEAVGTRITGPMVCLHCFTSEFPTRSLPTVQYRYVEGRVEHVRQGPTLHVRDSSPFRAFSSSSSSPSLAASSSSPLGASSSSALTVLTPLGLDEALLQMARGHLTSASFFTWGPKEYMDQWVVAIAKNQILEHAAKVNLEKGCPPQGPGLYLAKTIMSSICWAQFGDPHPLMVTLTAVPTLIFTGRRERAEFARQVSVLCAHDYSVEHLEAYLFSSQFSIPCLKFYGNFAVLSTATNVVATADEAVITRASRAGMKTASGSTGAGAEKCKEWLKKY